MPETDTIPVSASIASTGPGIRYIGDHCYAFSGDFSAQTSLSTELEFVVGSGYIVSELQFNGYVDDNNITAGQIGGAVILFNDIVIATLKNDTISEDMPSVVTMKMIIPPQTKVEIKCIAGGLDVNAQASLILTGRVYGEK